MDSKKHNNSPWLHQLKRTRKVSSIDQPLLVDIAVIGGGIAGITTAYYLLKHTSASVAVLEADQVAHGATGHNAGQLTTYFEKPLYELAREHGLLLAAHAQASVESAWHLLDEIREDCGLSTPLWKFTGYAGLTSMAQVRHHLENNAVRVAGGLEPERIYVSGEHLAEGDLPAEHKHLFQVVPQSYILPLLETKKSSYVAALCYTKGCMNSAVFTEELAEHLLSRFPTRLVILERTPVSTVLLGKGSAELRTKTHPVRCGRVVLCTNGFENIHIGNGAGPNIDTAYHHSLEGRVGYMAAYLEPLSQPPAAVSYYEDPSDDPEKAYYYLTRRPFDWGGASLHNLLSVGGPDRLLPESEQYDRTGAYPNEAAVLIQNFVDSTYVSETKPEEIFRWHGLMGYTQNRVRLIGPEPKNPILLYNLGCNGVGLMPSIYGAQKIARFINGEQLAPSMFDPKTAP